MENGIIIFFLNYFLNRKLFLRNSLTLFPGAMAVQLLVKTVYLNKVRLVITHHRIFRLGQITTRNLLTFTLI